MALSRTPPRYVSSSFPPVALGTGLASRPIAVILSGCGVQDGSEITEAVGITIALSQAGLPYRLFAPQRPQHHVVDHGTGEESDQIRDIWVEANRLGRGAVEPLARLDAQDFAAVVLPGGFGAAKNLCTYAFNGSSAQLKPDVSKVLTPFLLQKKPMAALCIAPVILGLLAKEQGHTGALLTLGEQGPHSEALEGWGAHHVSVPNGTAVVDEVLRFVSAPAYMYPGATPAQVFACCQALVSGLQQLLG